RSRADTCRTAERLANSDRLQRSRGAGAGGPTAGGVRTHRITAHRQRESHCYDAAIVARRPAGTGHPRSRRILAVELLRRAQRHARPISEARLARESAYRDADISHETKALTSLVARGLLLSSKLQVTNPIHREREAAHAARPIVHNAEQHLIGV